MRLLFTSHQGSTAKTKRIRGKQPTNHPKARALGFSYTNSPKLIRFSQLGLVSL